MDDLTDVFANIAPLIFPVMLAIYVVAAVLSPPHKPDPQVSPDHALLQSEAERMMFERHEKDLAGGDAGGRKPAGSEDDDDPDDDGLFPDDDLPHRCRFEFRSFRSVQRARSVRTDNS